MAIDCIKHITTLATGTIVFSGAIFDRLPKPRHAAALFPLSLLFMVLSVLASFFYLFFVGVMPHWRGAEPDSEKVSKVGRSIYFSFAMGLAGFGIFVAVNFLAK